MRLILAAIVVLAAGAIWWALSDNGSTPPVAGGQTPIVTDLNIPELNDIETAGKAAFEENCSVCHGVNAAGNDGAGPPLVHIIYEPNHHGDASFVLAARNGVRAHHWQFGNMPPVADVSDAQIAGIIAYVRKLQRANGIE